MATQAHCAYCFETIAASLERRQPLNLVQTETLWKKYSDGSESEEDDDDDNVIDEDISNNSRQPAAISRLLAPSPASISSTSVPSTSSTPSVASQASSASTASKASSLSSVFSLGRRSKEQDKPKIITVDASPLFVTWNTVLAGGKEVRLRGCIGTFEDHELDDGLRSYAMTSAFGDLRFEKIKRSELPTLECGVTLLTSFEDISNPLDWVVGTHGLRIRFTHEGRTFGSTYLPDVAKEQDWLQEITLISLMRKAGWYSPKDQWRSVNFVEIVRYQGRQVKLRYPQWKEWRDWVKQQQGL